LTSSSTLASAITPLLNGVAQLVVHDGAIRVQHHARQGLVVRGQIEGARAVGRERNHGHSERQVQRCIQEPGVVVAVEHVGRRDGIDLAQKRPEMLAEELRVGEFLHVGIRFSGGWGASR
jgi:hypothetical protein